VVLILQSVSKHCVFAFNDIRVWGHSLSRLVQTGWHSSLIYCLWMLIWLNQDKPATLSLKPTHFLNTHNEDPLKKKFRQKLLMLVIGMPIYEN
jgi:hypothetical protein